MDAPSPLGPVTESAVAIEAPDWLLDLTARTFRASLAYLALRRRDETGGPAGSGQSTTRASGGDGSPPVTLDDWSILGIRGRPGSEVPDPQAADPALCERIARHGAPVWLDESDRPDSGLGFTAGGCFEVGGLGPFVLVVRAEAAPPQKHVGRGSLEDLLGACRAEIDRQIESLERTSVVDRFDEAYFAVDEAWRLTRVNAPAERLFGAGRDALLGLPLRAAFPDAARSNLASLYRDAARTDDLVSFTAYHPIAGKWIRVRTKPSRKEMAFFARDVTEEKRRIDDLEHRDTLLQQTQRLAGGWIVDPDGDEGGVTEEVYRIHGLSPDEEMNLERSLSHYPEKARATLRDAFEKCATEGVPYDLELPLVTEDGRQRWVRTTGTAIYEDGDIARVAGAIQDITTHRETLDALRRERDLLQRIFDASAAAITVLNEEGKIVRASARSESVLGRSPEDIMGVSYNDPLWNLETVDGEPLDREENPFARVLHGETVFHDDRYAIDWPDGEQHILSINGAPLRAADGKLIGAVFVSEDVTETHARAQALREERQRLEMALTGGKLGLWDLNLNTGYNYVDERWAHMLGYTRDEVGETVDFFYDHVHPDDLHKVHDAFARHTRGETPFVDIEIRLQTKDGSWRWVLDRGKIVERNEDGSPKRAVGTHLDVTERREREEALRESNIALEQAQSVARMGTGVWDLEAGTVELSAEAGRLLGIEPDVEHPPSALFRVLHPEDRATMRREFEGLRHGKIHNAEYRVVHPDTGDERWLRGRARPHRWRDGRVVRVLGTVLDITGRRRMEDALRRSEERFRSLVEQSVDVVAIVDPAGTFMYVSPSVEEMTGRPADELEGADALEGVHPEDAAEVRRTLFYALRNPGENVEVEARYRHRDGPLLHLSIRGCRISTSAEGPALLVNVRDVTEQRNRHQRLIEAKEAAEDASQLKSAVLANMSHEIRTPLTSVIGFAQSLTEMDLGDPAERFAELIRSGGERLLDTLNSVLDFSQLEAEAVEMHPKWVPVDEAVGDVVAEFSQRAQTAGVELVASTEPSNLGLYTDAGALRSVLTNLVSNAVKFTSEGGRVAVRSRREPGGGVQITVEDTGVGIEEAFIEQAFEAFRQESTGDAREYSGNGLGLAIVSRYVELMGGEVDIWSEKGTGTRVTVHLPDREEAEEGESDAMQA